MLGKMTCFKGRLLYEKYLHFCLFSEDTQLWGQGRQFIV